MDMMLNNNKKKKLTKTIKTTELPVKRRSYRVCHTMECEWFVLCAKNRLNAFKYKMNRNCFVCYLLPFTRTSHTIHIMQYSYTNTHPYIYINTSTNNICVYRNYKYVNIPVNLPFMYCIHSCMCCVVQWSVNAGIASLSRQEINLLCRFLPIRNDLHNKC